MISNNLKNRIEKAVNKHGFFIERYRPINKDNHWFDLKRAVNGKITLNISLKVFGSMLIGVMPFTLGESRQFIADYKEMRKRGEKPTDVMIGLIEKCLAGQPIGCRKVA